MAGQEIEVAVAVEVAGCQGRSRAGGQVALADERRIPAGEDRDLLVTRDGEVVAAVVVEVPDRDRPGNGPRADHERLLEAPVPPPGKDGQDRSRGVREDDVGIRRPASRPS